MIDGDGDDDDGGYCIVQVYIHGTFYFTLLITLVVTSQ